MRRLSSLTVETHGRGSVSPAMRWLPSLVREARDDAINPLVRSHRCDGRCSREFPSAGVASNSRDRDSAGAGGRTKPAAALARARGCRLARRATATGRVCADCARIRKAESLGDSADDPGPLCGRRRPRRCARRPHIYGGPRRRLREECRGGRPRAPSTAPSRRHLARGEPRPFWRHRPHRPSPRHAAAQRPR